MRSTLTRLAARLRSERGEGDPVLTVIGMLVTALISASIIGTIILVIQVGSNVVRENITAATVTQAQKMWAQDANNASTVFQYDEHHVTLYEVPGRHPGVYINRPGQTAEVCRKSEWAFVDGTITNRVSQWDNATCDLDDSGLAPDRVATPIGITGADPTTHIESFNAAGRDLHFVDGEEIGLADDSEQPSTADRKSWWRDYEWEYDQPRKINLVSSLDMPLSGTTPTVLRGNTWITTTNEGDTTDDVEEEPETTPYNPGQITGVNVTRSSTVGDIYAFVREGIDISFNGVSCGPYSTEYTVNWTPSTPGAIVRETSFTSFTQPGIVSFDRVPNGAAGVVTVIAACPSSVSDTPATVQAAYTQPLPGPSLTGSIGTPPNRHTLTWTATSSLPLEYRLEVDLGAGYEPQEIAVPNPTHLTSQTLVWPLGSTYGVPHNYQVVALVGAVEGDRSNEVTLYTPWPSIPAPPITGESVTPQYRTTIGNVTCPAGTYGEYRQRIQVNGAGWQGWSPWSTTNHTMLWTVEQGQKYDIQGQARCTFNGSTGSDPQDANPNPLEWVEPITTTPNPPTVTPTDVPGEENPVEVRYATAGCPAQTHAEFRVRYSINEGTMGPWSAWSTTPQTLVSMWYGERLMTEVQARCSTPWTDGPPSTTDPGPWDRPIPAPVAPTNIRSDAGGTSEPVNNRVLWDGVECWVGTTPQYRPMRNGTTAEGSWGGALTYNVATGWGTTYVYAAAARCITTYEESPAAVSTTTAWTTNVPTPTAYIGVPGSAYAGNSFAITMTANCPAGTSTYFERRDNYATGWVAVAGTSYDFWSSARTVTYTGRALCSGPNANGAWSNHVSDTISITNPPAPPAVGGWSEQNYGFCAPLGGRSTIFWSAAPYASTYNAQWARQTRASGSWSSFMAPDSSTASSASSAIINNVTYSGYQWRVQASGSGGTGPWGTSLVYSTGTTTAC